MFTAYVFMVLSIFHIALVFSDDDATQACLDIFNPKIMKNKCCLNIHEMHLRNSDAKKECKISDDKWTCSDIECVLTKSGFAEDGKIKDSAVKEILEEVAKQYPDEKAITDRIEEQCLNGGYEDYPPEDGCFGQKFTLCVHINAVLGCNSWKDTEECTAMGDRAKQCLSALEKGA